MLSSTVAAARLPLIAICGTTGVGKSNLAIELALELARRAASSGSPWVGARIINADAMQCYAGMDVITNKVSDAEMKGVEHLLMGHKQPGEQYVVGQWVQDATKAIEETHRRHQIPIVVGGTSYWIQHLLFPNRLAQPEPPAYPTAAPMSDAMQKSVDGLSSELRSLYDSIPEHPPSASDDPTSAFALHSLLNALDPLVAARWHWRDTRKVLRNLQIMKETGRLPSEIMSTQSNQVIEPRYRTLLYWLYAHPDALNPRLDARVDSMIKSGLLHEIRALQAIAASASTTTQSDPDYTLGIYQSIGYKEFHDYLTATDPPARLFEEAVERMKLSTRQYAKRQISWIRNKLLPLVNHPSEEPVAHAYLFNATELGTAWHSHVLQPALQITTDFLAGNALPDPQSLSDAAKQMLVITQKPVDPHAVLEARRKVVCSICTLDPAQPCMIEEGAQWAAHERTKVHRRLASKSQREAAVKAAQESKRKARSDQASTNRSNEEVAVADLFLP
ncbi:hypothetical protein HGRIS_013373 [Hohenbuehelia grisea]|uniref:tRNA isopentenyltransferase n=1 Tax=Hohenbuehelia grisea TaxID=104357 RepID=A0ABR3IVE7_9AGAR